MASLHFSTISGPYVLVNPMAFALSPIFNSGSTKNFLDRAKEEQTIFLALALMIPPLLFAFVSQYAKAKKIEKIGEETLRESFYVQCYYFSPLSVAIWATYYAYYFFTVNAYWYLKFSSALQILLSTLLYFEQGPDARHL